MKSLNFLLIVVIIFNCITGCNQAVAKSENQSQQKESIITSIPVEGAWKLVWAQYNDTLADMSNHKLVKMFTNGSFSLFAHDSTGKINFVGYGKYNFEGDTYHEKFLYHNRTNLIGGEDWQNLSVKGDTMYLDGITKVVVGGKDMTSGWTKVKEKLVKVDW